MSKANWIDIGVIIACTGFLWIAMTAKMDGNMAKVDGSIEVMTAKIDGNMQIMMKEFQHIRKEIEDNSAEDHKTQGEPARLKIAFISNKQK